MGSRRVYGVLQEAAALNAVTIAMACCKKLQHCPAGCMACCKKQQLQANSLFTGISAYRSFWLWPKPHYTAAKVTHSRGQIRPCTRDANVRVGLDHLQAQARP